MSSTDYGEPVLLLTLDTELEADMLLDLLQSQQIPAFKKFRGAWGALRLSMGVTSLGVEVYVPQKLRQQALEVAESINMLDE